MVCQRSLSFALAVLILSAGVPGVSRATWPSDPNVNVPLCTASNSQILPVVTSDGAGGAIITWQDYRSGSKYDIYAQRVNAAGVAQWTVNGVLVCSSANDKSHPGIVSDGAGGAIITWQDFRTDPTFLIYAQRLNAAGVPQWAADGVALCTAPSSQAFPTIVSDGVGGAIVTWDDTRGGGSFGKVYAQRVSSAGVPLWAADGVELCTALSDQALPTIASDGAGGAIVTWYSAAIVTSYDAPNANADIYAQRVNAAGMPQWAADGVALCTAANEQALPILVSDGAGGAIVAWADHRGSNYDIYAQQVNAAGVPQWAADGVALCTAANDQGGPSVESDGAGGAIVTWGDDRASIFNYDIYAQRVTGGGVPQWTADGIALCTALHDQTFPTIVSDGTGGAIVTWQDLRGANLDVYARRVNAAGVPQWAANGVALCTAANAQRSPTIVSDGAGGAIVTWGDFRGGFADIYAQRVSPDGSLGGTIGVSTAISSGFALTLLSANPARGEARLGFVLPRAAKVRLGLYDVAGRALQVLASGAWESGEHMARWDGRDSMGRSMGSGMYLARLQVDGGVLDVRFVLLR